MDDNLQIPPVMDKESVSKLTINGQEFKTLIEAALTWLKTNQQTVNSLNVFPVPDGDTGTNMVLTMQAANNDIINSGERNIGRISHAIAQGALMGARGNSGVILSQLWRGFARSMDNLEYMDAENLVKALTEARATAYKGVVRPVEGTILTVAKDIEIAAEQAIQETRDLVQILDKLVDAADKSVAHTPELLPILKQAGVVDSGGKGLFFILEGMQRAVRKQSLETPLATIQPLSMINTKDAFEEIEPGQDYEVVIDFKPLNILNVEKLYGDLSQMGTSIQLGEGDNIYRMHIHVPTENRYKPITYIEELGSISKVSIENLLSQMEEANLAHSSRIKLTPVGPGEIAVVVISPGVGLSRIFASLGAAAIVDGGQTMNPSTEEILKAFEDLPTNDIIILPNNKNIIMAAQATIGMTVKRIGVIPSKSIPQGLSAMLRLAPDGDFDQVVHEMKSALNDVDTGEITVATRSVEMNGVQVNQGEVIALHNGQLIYSSNNLKDACLTLLEKANTNDKERITFFYGNNISKTDVNEIVDIVRSQYSKHEIEIHEGGQPYYQFIIAIE